MRVSASSAPSGSSSARTRGRLTSARASATRCFWPPDSTDGHSPRRSSRPTALRTLARAGNRRRLAAVPVRADFHVLTARVAQGSSRGSWNMTRTSVDDGDGCAFSPSQNAPRSADPALRSGAAACSCRSRCVRRSRRNWPAGMCRSMPRSTSLSPKLLREAPDGQRGPRAAVACDRGRSMRACSTIARCAREARRPTSETKRLLHVSSSVFLESRMPGEASAVPAARDGAVGELAEQRIDQDRTARRRRSA